VIPTFLGITILIFGITRLVPGGPVERMMTQMQAQGDGGSSLQRAGDSSALSEAQMEDLRAFYGLDKPVVEAYMDWLGKLANFDLGESTRYYEPVADMIAERLPVSLFYGGMTFFISYFISLPLGYYKALKHGSVFDSSSSVLIFIGFALPGYVVGVLLITLFSYHLEWFPMGGFVGDAYYDATSFLGTRQRCDVACGTAADLLPDWGFCHPDHDDEKQPDGKPLRGLYSYRDCQRVTVPLGSTQTRAA
jgi:ABC-type uncharacterized transport system, permease component